MKKLTMLVTLSLGAFLFADDEDKGGQIFPNCPPTCGVKTEKKLVKIVNPRTP